ncbi:MAG: TraB/GumN family protein [Bacteroidota bacterium]
MNKKYHFSTGRYGKYITAFFAATMFILLSSLQPEPEKALLWRIEKETVAAPSYLFGTIHIIEKDKYYFPEYMQECFEACDALVTEILIDIPLKDQLAMAQRMVLPANKTYKDYLSDEDFERLKNNIVDSLDIKEKKFERYIRIKPVYLSSLILSEMLKKPTAYEQNLTKEAKKLSLELLALETLYEQLDILESLPDEEVFSYFSEDYDLLQEYNGLINKYLEQDIHAIYNTIQEEESINDFESQLLSERNQRWLPVLDSLMTKKSCFIAVGAGHLSGGKGILNLLKEQGYKISPVTH